MLPPRHLLAIPALLFFISITSLALALPRNLLLSENPDLTFLLVDKIIELTDTHIVGVKNVTFNEWFFPGHFPGNPVMPGVLQIEALAQTGGILCINSMPEGQYDTYFLKIDNCKFKQMVRPGDTMLLKMEFTGPIRRGICEMRGTVYVGGKVATEADLVAQIVKRS